MRMFKLSILRNLTVLFLLVNSYAYSVHVWGGELEASCDGSNNYTFRLSLFVDCGRVNGMSATERINVYDKTGNFVQSITLNNFVRDTLPTVPNACAKTVTGTCIGRVVAQSTTNIPMNADGYVISYSSCCRNSNIGNVSNPGSTGQIYTIELPGTNQVATCNSAPVFNSLPPSEICTNLPVEIDFSATDSDADVLVYKLFHPYGDINGTYNGGPPFPNITFTGPYGFDNPMNAGLTIDENTGIITGVPVVSGLFALGVVVEEWRGGILIGRKVRDFTYTVVPCDPGLSVGEPEILTCANEPVAFSFNFTGVLSSGTAPLWDFGDPTSSDNSSNLFNPVHQYSELGNYTALVSLTDSCGNTIMDSIKVDIIETVATVSNPGTYCIGDEVTLTSTDGACSLTEWYTGMNEANPVYTGCEYKFTLNDDSVCIYFEPFIDPSNYIVGANASQGFGTDFFNTVTFDAITPLTINGFTVDGDQFWPSCADFNAMVTVEQGSTIISGPEFITLDCNEPTVVTGIDLDVPEGTGYQLRVTGATLKPTSGAPVNRVGLIDIDAGGPFYNIDVVSNQKCARRDSVCITSDCPCPDTTLSFPSNFCVNQAFDLNTLLTVTTSPGTWSIKNIPVGSSPAIINNDSIFDGANADAGIYTVLFTVDGIHPGCTVKNERDIEIYALDTADILPHGPYCIGEGPQTIEYSITSTAGGVWTSDAVGAINGATGIFNLTVADTGSHWVFYDSQGTNCPVQDSIQIQITDLKEAQILNSDTTVCLNSNDFIIRKSTNSSVDGNWFGQSSDSLFSPSTEGVFNIKYVANGASLACSDSDSVTITVQAIDSAAITLNQGPFCKLGGNQILSLDTVNTILAGTWSSITVGAISANGIFDPLTADLGIHKVYYTTPGPLCPITDSINIEVIDILSATIATPDTSVCVNSNAFAVRKANGTSTGGQWTGVNLSDSLFNPSTVGTFKVKYTITGITAACSDSDSITVTVIAPDTVDITPNQGPFCKLAGNKNLTVEATTTAGGAWSSNIPGVISAAGEFNPLISDTGNHWVYHASPGPLCPVSDSIQIQIVDALDAEITTNDTTVCLNSTPFVLRKGLNTPDNGIWIDNGVSDSLFTPGSVGTFSIKYALLGLGIECSDIDSIEITVLPTPDGTITPPSPNEFCVGDTAITIVNKDTAGTGTWWSDPIGAISSIGVFDPSFGQTGAFEIFYGITGQCGDTSSTSVTIYPVKNPTIIDVPDLCEIAEDETLQAINIGTWSVNGLANNGIFSAQNFGPGLHRIINTINDNCPISDTIFIDVKENPVSELGSDTIEGCYPMEVTFEDLSDSNALTTTWTVFDGIDTLFQTSQLDSLQYLFGNEGCFDISIASTYDYGCESSATLPYQICTHTPPNADFDFVNEPVSVKDPIVYTHNTSIDATSFFWKFGANRPLVNNDNELVVQYDINEQDTVDISLVATNGWCNDTITRSIIIWDFFTLYTPNAFTPNGDGYNDIFFPLGRNHIGDDYIFMIYNRWGDRIFETNVPYEGWDGKYKINGKECQQDVYVWKIITRDIYENELIQRIGTVTLIK